MHLQPIDVAGLGAVSRPSRILILYGSLRERSYSRLASEKRDVCCGGSGRTRTFDPSGLPLPDCARRESPPVIRRQRRPPL